MLAAQGGAYQVAPIAGAKAQALQKDGVQVVAGDLEEPDTLTEAFEGIDIMWLLTPASALEPSMGSNAVTAARKAKVGHIVRNSAIKAGHDAPNRNGRLHALVEESVKASGIPWTILRPHYYMQNLLSSAGSVASDGMLGLAWKFGFVWNQRPEPLKSFVPRFVTKFI